MGIIGMKEQRKEGRRREGGEKKGRKLDPFAQSITAELFNILTYTRGNLVISLRNKTSMGMYVLTEGVFIHHLKVIFIHRLKSLGTNF